MYRTTLAPVTLVFALLSAPAAWAAQETSYMTDADPNINAIRRAYAEQRDAEVLTLTEAALVERVGSDEDIGEIYFLRGSVLRRSRRHQEAIVALAAARRYGYRPPELHLENALALSAMGKSQDADQEMDEARRLAQDEEKRAFLEGQWRRRQDEGPKKFEARVRPQLGYDTNVVGVSDDTLLAEDVDRESFYYGVLLSAKYRLFDDQGRTLAIEYQNVSRAYSSESDLSYTDNLLALTGRVPLAEQIDFNARVAYGEAFMADDGHFRTLRSAGPGFLFRPAAGWELRLWGEWGDVDYYVDGPAEQDRDGTYQQAGLALRVDLGSGWTVSPFVSFLDYNSEGSDYERVEWQPGVTIAAPDVLGVQPSVTIGYVRADFDNPNSLTAFTEERQDRRFYVTFTLTVHALEEKLGFAPSISIRFEDWDSNIDAYDFSRWQPQIDFAFLAYSF